MDPAQFKKEIEKLKASLKTPPPLPDADISGVDEGEKFESLEDETKEDISRLSNLRRESYLAEQKANHLSQHTRKNILWLLKWPLLIGAVLIVLIAIVGLIAFFVVEAKVVIAVLFKTPSELLNIIRSLPTGVMVFGSLVAPLSALVVAITAWLFKKPKR